MKCSRREFIDAASGTLAAGALAPIGMSPDEDDPLGVRRDFPATKESIFLNSAYITPIPVQVVEAGRAFLEAKARRPISLGDMLAKTDEVRRQFARLVNADPEEIGFLYATTEGENVVARALQLQSGDNVVVDELHYEATYVLYKDLERTTGIQLRIARHRDGAVGVSDFEPLVDGRTRLLSVAWVSHQNGFLHDMKALADLAHAHGAYLYSDAIQAAGMFPIDVRATGVDFFAAGTYKWLLAGYGVAPFFVRRALLDRIPADRRGALQVEKDLGNYQYEIYKTARKFEWATLAFEPVYQLGAGLTYLERVGVDRIGKHAIGLAQEMRQGLAEQGFRLFTPAGNQSSIVTFFFSQDPQEVARILDGERIKVTLRPLERQIRVSTALFNNRSEIRHFLQTCSRFR
jgi:selenocysteine lyase/cysteine desulfurase